MLPPYRPGVNHIIKLKNDIKLPVLPIYTYSEEELRCEKETVNKLLH